MATKVVNVSASSPADLRRTFETAIERLQLGGVPSRSSQTPIAVHKRAAMEGDPNAEKRAVTEAARALAQLWNISRSLIR